MPAERSGTAALEFALIAPVLLTVFLGVLDLSRALIIWEETCSAARAVVEAASRLSVAANPAATTLTATQMQNAMSAIYATIPGLNLGAGTGIYAGSYSVTLSSVVFSPLCATASGCATQTPYVLWSSSLSEGGSKLVTSSVARSCGSLTKVTTLSNSTTRLAQMLDPALASGGGTIAVTPQIVADVQYVYQPIFSKFLGTVTFWATAALPPPINGTEQEVTFSTTAPTGNVVSCTVPS